MSLLHLTKKILHMTLFQVFGGGLHYAELGAFILCLARLAFD